jgi:hypothetical protein
LLQGEYSAWFKSSRWWKHLLLWFAIINLMMIFMLIASTEAAKGGEEGPPVLFMYGLFGGMFVAFGVMVIMQRVLVGVCHPAHRGDRAGRDLLSHPGVIQ